MTLSHITGTILISLTAPYTYLRGKQPKLSDKQQKELCRMHGSGEYSISDLAELFSVSRPTVYRTLSRGK
ncbi:Hin recombinase [Pantoea alhagi]|uniref:Hin recombinase n=1 Tax=Pantoea alhagi TaxID=1891675 RepID=A0A1W6BB94_9GAMM|nr:Hin recombinase [Pantoea alhagi]